MNRRNFLKTTAALSLTALTPNLLNANTVKPEIYPTGFPQFDEVMGGLRPGSKILILGLPGSGKTTFLNHIIKYNKLKGHNTEDFTYPKFIPTPTKEKFPSTHKQACFYFQQLEHNESLTFIEQNTNKKVIGPIEYLRPVYTTYPMYICDYVFSCCKMKDTVKVKLHKSRFSQTGIVSYFSI